MEPAVTLQCTACKAHKPPDDFGRRKDVQRGRDYYCRACRNAAKRRYQSADPLADLSIEVELPVHHVPSGVPLGPLPQHEAWGPAPALARPPPVLGRPELSHVFIPDLHMPWHSRQFIDRLVEFTGDVKPDHIWNLADLYDMFSFSKFPRTLNLMTPRQELNEAKFHAKAMWQRLQRASPESECHLLMGNHDERPIKRALENMPEAEDFVEEGLRGLMTFEGVELHRNQKVEVLADRMCIQHGHYSRPGQHALFNQMNSVHGHDHKLYVLWFNNAYGTFFEMSCGFGGDPDAPVFTYRGQSRITNTHAGCGYVGPRGPQAVPF